MPFSSHIPRPSSVRAYRRRGFTLTELMISVALALLLLVGINQVFKSTSATVGTSYASLEGARKQLSLDNVLTTDFSKVVPASDQPAIIIHSEAIPQYWDATDANSDLDSNVYTVDLDGDKLYTSAGENIDTSGTGVADLRSGRSHRVDRISFFARDKNHPFARQTGDVRRGTDNGDRLVSDEASSEAWISYGFLRLPSNGSNLNPFGAPGGDYYSPAQIDTSTSVPFLPSKNQNNYYVRDWALGRQCILLSSLPIGDYLSATLSGSPTLAPLEATSKAYSTTLNGAADNPVTGSPWLAAHSRYDIAQTTIRDYWKLLKNAGQSSGWYARLDYQFNGKPWVDRAATVANGQTSEFATTSTFLSRGVSQFIVEFAGDFCTQVNTPGIAGDGTVTSNQSDGIVDFVVAPVTYVRKTRWYGLPRDISGPSGVEDGRINLQYDVVPVRDFIGQPSAFEVVYPQSGVVNCSYPSDYPALPRGAQYICAWGPLELATSTTAPSSSLIGTGGTTAPQVTPGPWMIRVVVNVRDPNGRLPDGQQVEYVYTLKQ